MCATGNCDLEIETISVEDSVGARVGRREGRLDASTSDEDVGAGVQLLRNVKERLPVSGSRHGLQP